MKTPMIQELPSRVVGEREDLIQEGDAILIIRRNGDVIPMSMGIPPEDVAAVRAKDPDDWSDEERNLAMQGQNLFLLSMAVGSPVIMNILAEIANAPGVIDEEKIKTVLKLN